MLVVSVVVIGSTPPWWAVPIFGLAGTLVGAVIALLSSWWVTSRQLLRQEQAARRAMYAKWVETAATCGLRSAESAAAARVAEGAKAQLAKMSKVGNEDVTTALAKEVAALEVKAEERCTEFSKNLEEVRRRFYELSLYAPTEIRAQGVAISQHISKLHSAVASGTSDEQERARSALNNSITDFTILARADVGGPGGLSLSEAERRVSRLQDSETMAGVDDPRAS